MAWHYQARQKTYLTLSKDGENYETIIDVVECYENPKGWTEKSATFSAESKEELIRILENTINDLKNFDVIVEEEIKIIDLRDL